MVRAQVPGPASRAPRPTAPGRPPPWLPRNPQLVNKPRPGPSAPAQQGDNYRSRTVRPQRPRHRPLLPLVPPGRLTASEASARAPTPRQQVAKAAGWRGMQGPQRQGQTPPQPGASTAQPGDSAPQGTRLLQTGEGHPGSLVKAGLGAAFQVSSPRGGGIGRQTTYQGGPRDYTLQGERATPGPRAGHQGAGGKAQGMDLAPRAHTD